MSHVAFPQILGIIYFAAFVSLYPQVPSLIGERGILPAGDYLRDLHRKHGAKAWYLAPTIFWISASGRFLQTICAAGAALSILLAAGLAPTALLAATWLFYLSFYTVGQTFLAFQWDILLIECGLLAILLPLWPEAVVWLFRWLLFRLMFLSGATKLMSGDPSWRNLTALAHHYETQPLPNRLSWYMHQLPVWFHKLSTFFMFAVELAIPFLFFGPQPARIFAAGATIALQLLIQLTGNYTFFNMLSIGLCVFLPEQAGLSASRLLTPGHLLVLALAVLILIVSSCRMWLMFGGSPLPRPLADLLSALSPFPIANTYGLFSVMTKVRPEIVIEASCDGVQWSEYQFKFKPGQTARAPRLVAPHQPRLDWQMWFAALNPHYNIWFIRFVILLLQGSPAPRSLLARGSPSIGHPPKFVRALLYRYRFTTPQEKRATGMWWKRSLVREYLPPVSISLNRYGIDQRAEDQVTAAGRTPVRATPES